MADWQLGVLLRPFLALIVYAALIGPLSWLIGKCIPEGRFKEFMTKDRTRSNAPLRDRVIYGAILLGSLVGFVWYAGYTYSP